MTPEKARELLDKSTPGPWRADDVSLCECCTDVKASAAFVCTADMDDAPLIAAAPALAHLVASMYFMYAVQIEGVAGETRFAESAHGTTPDVRDAWWTSAPNTALADHWRENTNANDVRIVRRLMADPEVVDDPPAPSGIHFCTEEDLFGDIDEVVE